MVPTALQLLVMFFALLPSMPALAREIQEGAGAFTAVAHACSGNGFAVAIGMFYVLELSARLCLACVRRQMGAEASWACAVLHAIVASVVLICLACDVADVSGIAMFRQKLWGMQYQLAVAGLSLAHAIRELRHLRH